MISRDIVSTHASSGAEVRGALRAGEGEGPRGPAGDFMGARPWESAPPVGKDATIWLRRAPKVGWLTFPVEQFDNLLKYSGPACRSPALLLARGPSLAIVRRRSSCPDESRTALP